MPYASPALGDVHVNRPLTNLAIAFMANQTGYVADRIFPNIPVVKQSDAYFVFDRGDWNRDDVKERAPGAESAGGTYEIGQQAYFARVKAFHKDVPDQLRANQDSPINLDNDATNFVMTKHLLHRELSWANEFFMPGKWLFEVEGGGAPTARADLNPDSGKNGGNNNVILRWSDAASTPIEDLRWLMTYQQLRSGFRPNKLVIGRPVFDILADHPGIIGRMVAASGNGDIKQATREGIAKLLELDEVVVMDGIVNAAKQGLEEANAFIGGKHALLVYANPAPGLMTPSAGYTFSWTGFLGASDRGVRIKRFYMDPIESTRVEGQQAFAQQQVAKDLAIFIRDIVA